MPMACAAESERSMTRFATKGPRSLMRTSVCIPFRRFVTRTSEPKRQRAVRRGECVHVVNFAVRRAVAVEGNAVPRCHALFHILTGDRGLASRRRRRSRRQRTAVRQRGYGACGLAACTSVSATRRRDHQRDTSTNRSRRDMLPRRVLRPIRAGICSAAGGEFHAAIPVHLFALKFGIIGMRSHSRKERNWNDRRR